MRMTMTRTLPARAALAVTMNITMTTTMFVTVMLVFHADDACHDFQRHQHRKHIISIVVIIVMVMIAALAIHLHHNCHNCRYQSPDAIVRVTTRRRHRRLHDPIHQHQHDNI